MMSGRITYRQACRQNAPASACPICFRPTAKPRICDSCYADLSKSGNLLEKKEKAPCPTTSQ